MATQRPEADPFQEEITVRYGRFGGQVKPLHSLDNEPSSSRRPIGNSESPAAYDAAPLTSPAMSSSAMSANESVPAQVLAS